MADGRRRDEYNRWAPFRADFVNANRDPKESEPAQAADFHPYLKREDVVVMKLDLKDALAAWKPKKPR